MKGDQSQEKIPLSSLIYEISQGFFVIPNFQREFEWEPSHVRELIRSIFLDYYIGSLLVWKGKDDIFDQLACQPIYGFEGKDRRLKIVLDGQQRLTAMYLAFMGSTKPHPNRQSRFFYFVHVDQFINEDYDGAFFYEYSKKGEKLVNNKKNQFKQNIFPLSVMGDDSKKFSWLGDYENYWKKQVKIAKNEGNAEKILIAQSSAKSAKLFREYLVELGAEYNVSFIELDKDMDIDKVCDIFTQINSRGMRLDIFDLINAMLIPQDIHLKQMYQEAKKRLSFVESDRMNVYLLQVMSILRQDYCSPKYLFYLIPGKERKIRELGHLSTEILFSNNSEFKKSWLEAVNSMEKVIGLLKNPQEIGRAHV